MKNKFILNHKDLTFPRKKSMCIRMRKEFELLLIKEVLLKGPIEKMMILLSLKKQPQSVTKLLSLRKIIWVAFL